MLTTILIILLVCASPVLLAVLILVTRDVLIARDPARFNANTIKIKNALRQFAPLAIMAVVVFVLGSVLVSTVENWGSIVCWENDHMGTMSRTCALHKISESNDFKEAEVTEITGIAELTENVKRVEFKWRLKPTPKDPNPQPVDGTLKFRKYDDGWRPSEE